MPAETCYFKFSSIIYNVKPKVNKEISFSLLENMLLQFTKLRAFSFARDVKEKR